MQLLTYLHGLEMLSNIAHFSVSFNSIMIKANVFKLDSMPSKIFLTSTFSGKMSPPKSDVENDGMRFNVCRASTI